MTLPYSEARSGQAREAEIRDNLRKCGASAIGFMVDDDAGQIIAQFRLRGREITVPVSFRGYEAAWRRENPHRPQHKTSAAAYAERARQTAERATWAILADWIKAQAAMITTGLMDQDEAFLAHVHLPDGRRVVGALRAQTGPLALPDLGKG